MRFDTISDVKSPIKYDSILSKQKVLAFYLRNFLWYSNK